jgi:hypothetical protein
MAVSARSAAFGAGLAEDFIAAGSRPGTRTVISSPTTLSSAGVTRNASRMNASRLLLDFADDAVPQ